MNITKPNDIFVATISNPSATSYDLMSNGFNGENTSLFSKEEYQKTDFAQKTFTDESGKFDTIAFENAFNQAQQNYYNLTNEQYLKDLNSIKYSPFDITRPKDARTFDVSSKIEKEYNPFKQLYGWTGVGSIDDNSLSLRELAQQNKVFDPATKTWSQQSAADLSLKDKLFGETLVYAQWDDDGIHTDLETGRAVEHKKGDWKYDEGGNLYLEKLAGREVYGKQVVNPMDILTTEGSTFDKFNFLDSDDREKSITGTIFKTAFQIAPYFIPEIGPLKGALAVRSLYGGLNASIGLAATLPTFYKAIEGFLLGDANTTLTKGATNLEGWMAKYTTPSTSDEGQKSMFSVEQMASMVGSIFSQIHEQRAVASLSKYIVRADTATNKKIQELGSKINQELLEDAIKGKIDFKDINDLSKAAMSKIPELQSVIKTQSNLSKALSLGYMALNSTSDIYGEALAGGYDRRVAGFAALASAIGQYLLMMNNRMGDWFLDKTTGYNLETNTALLRKSVKPYFKQTQDAFNLLKSGQTAAGNRELGGILQKIRKNITEVFTSPSELKEAMWKNALVEGVEEVTEQATLDMTKGVIDTMSALGLLKKQGSFGGFANVFSTEGLENYLANFVGGLLGGSLFEFHRQKIEPLFSPNSLDPETKKDLYHYIAEGKKDELIKIVNNERPNLGNRYLTPMTADGSFQEVTDANKMSQADLIADNVIGMIEVVDGILNNHDLIQTDDEIIRKTLRDEIIIKNLKQTAKEGSSIGIEGLVLEDIQRKTDELVDLELELKKIPEKEQESQYAKILKNKIKVVSDDINDILEGNQGHNYFRKAIFFLSNKINKGFLNIDKASYTEENYHVDYTTLPRTGIGLTQEKIDKEWNEYLDSKDLRKDLELADKMYVKWENLLNGTIADYVDLGYSEERKVTYNLLQDAKKTLELFNMETDEVKKEAIFKHFIEINNQLTAQGETTIGPWTVFQDTIYDDLVKLNLIKKLNYQNDDSGNLIETYEDFDDGELDSVLSNGEVKRDFQKRVIKGFFQNYPSNPANIESIITQFNNDIKNHNLNVLKQIQEVSLEPESEEQQAKLSSLNDNLLDITVLNFDQTEDVRALEDKWNIEKQNLLAQYAISEADFNKYLFLKDTSSKAITWDALLAEFNLTQISDATSNQLDNFINKLVELGIYSETLDALEKSSANSAEEVQKNIALLQTDLEPDKYVDIQEKLQPFLDRAADILNHNYTILSDDNYSEVNSQLKSIRQEFTNEIDQLKPDLFKLKNRAFSLTLDFLKQGNVDKEVFLFAEEIFETEKAKFLSLLFPTFTDLDYIETLKFMEVVPAILINISDRMSEESMLVEDEDYEETVEDQGTEISQAAPKAVTIEGSTIQDLITEQEALIKDGNYSGLFVNLDALNFIKKYFDSSKIMESFMESIRAATKAFKQNQDSTKMLNEFLELTSKGLNLKSNPLYDFIRNLAVTLNSNPNNKVAKIFDILKKEETTLRASSNILNYSSDSLKEQDLEQAIQLIDLMSSVVYAMSTTNVDYEDPIGFIAARQQYAKKYGIDDEVLNLKTITSDNATLMLEDLALIKNKLKFYKEFGSYNASKTANEQEIIRETVEQILLSKWTDWLQTLNPKFFPKEVLRKILDSSESNAKKLMQIEEAIFLHNQAQKEEALEGFLLGLSAVNPLKVTPINRDAKTLSDWDLAVYLATTLSLNSKDFYIRSLNSLNGTFTKALLFTQEFVSKIVKASTIEPNLFSKIYQIKQNSKYTDISFITVVVGNAGTGKTSAVFGLDLEHFKQTNDTTNIWASAPTDLQVNNLYSAIQDSTGLDKLEVNKFTKTELFEKLGLVELVNQIEQEVQTIADVSIPKKYVRLSSEKFIEFTEEFLAADWLNNVDLSILPNLLLIDEITHYSFFELKILHELSKLSYNAGTSNFMKIIGAGDTSQLGYLAKVDNKYYSYNVETMNAIFTPKLWSNIRSTNAQNKLNTELMTRISGTISGIYSDNPTDLVTASSLSHQFLENTNKEKLNLLTYYEDEKELFGSKIISNLTTPHLKPIIANLQENPTKIVGYLSDTVTDVSELPEDILKVLTDAGLIKTDGSHPNLRVFNTKNIQGSEVDYFIFDTVLTTKYDKIRDNIKAFYTYMTRAKDGTLIIDSEDILKENYKIFQGEKEKTPQRFELLTKTVIDKLKETKKKFYTDLVGEHTQPTDNFKWKTNLSAGQFEITNSRFVLADIPEPMPNASDNVSKIEKELSKDKFKVMNYSFYNNPNVDIVELEKGNIVPNINNPNTDLNIINTLSGKQAESVIQNWTKLKYYLLYNLDNDNVITTNFQSYFENIFCGLSGSESVKVEIVLTANKMDRKYNTPFKKQGFKAEEVLKNGESFINVSAKLIWGNHTHYVTLATLGSEKKILEKSQEYNINQTDVQKLFVKIDADLKENSFVSYTIDKNKLEFLTSTILWKPKDKKAKEKFPISDLPDKFPGMNFSEVRFIPHTRNLFTALFNKYVFGESRNMAITTDDTGKEVFADKDLEKRFLSLRNKPYIVVSYNNDLDGNELVKNTQARIVMLGSNKRDFQTITQEVNTLLTERKDELSNNIKSGTSDKISPELNAKTEMLLNRNDILEILIKWGTTLTDNPSNPAETYLDLLFKEMPFKITDSITGNKTSVFEIFTRFNNTAKQITSENLKTTINLVKNTIAKNKNNPELIKSSLIKSMDRTAYWHWSFFNIFGYDQIITALDDAEFSKLLVDGVFSEEDFELFNTVDNKKEMRATIKKLLDVIKDMEFYYSIPIKPGPGGTIIANPLISSKNHFDKQFFGDKFFIDVAPESARLMIDFNTLLGSVTNKVTPNIITTGPTSTGAITQPPQIAVKNSNLETPEEEQVGQELNILNSALEESLNSIKEIFTHPDMNEVPLFVSELVQLNPVLLGNVAAGVQSLITELNSSPENLKPSNSYLFRKFLEELGVKLNQNDLATAPNIMQVLGYTELNKAQNKDKIQYIIRKINALVSKKC